MFIAQCYTDERVCHYNSTLYPVSTGFYNICYCFYENHDFHTPKSALEMKFLELHILSLPYFSSTH